MGSPVDQLDGPRMRMKIRLLDAGLEPPSYAHSGDAGLDLRARTAVRLAPDGGRALVPTGVAVELPEGHVGLVCPRSGMALERGITVLNGPGVVDVGYRGEIGVVLINHDQDNAVDVSRGDRIAQLLIVPVLAVELEVVEELAASDRAEAGFGQSGVS